MLFIVFLIIIHNISRLQRQSSLYQRKIVHLRSLLNINYSKWGILPEDQTLSADDPFKIKRFEYYDPSFLIILLINASISLYYLYRSYLVNAEINYQALIYIVASSIYLFISYRKQLFEDNENKGLYFIKAITKILCFELVKNFEIQIRNIKYSIEECKRNKIDLRTYYEFLVAIEDATYFEHRGINCKRIFFVICAQCIKKIIYKKCFFKFLFRFSLHTNIVKSFFTFSFDKNKFKHLLTGKSCRDNSFSERKKYINKIKSNMLFVLYQKVTSSYGGASTITQQFVRTNFILEKSYKKIFRRKMIEILLSFFWASIVF